MERRRKPSKSLKGKTNNIYMDLKEILRVHALRYLPAKTLYRSLTVCRDWKLQISTPFFVHNQSVSFGSISGLFIQSPGKPPSFLSLDRMAYGVPDPELKFLPEPVDVKSSSNGLLCCQGRTGERAYYVCNPVNQQWKKLPKPTNEHGSDAAPILIYEPSLLNFVAEYQVVCIFQSADLDDAYEFEIYSSAQDSWKTSEEMYFAKQRHRFKNGICLKGVAYWPMSSGQILSFDLKKGRAATLYSMYGYDYGYGYDGVSKSMGQVNGKLCMSSMRGLSVTVSTLETIYANTMPMKSNTQPWKTTHKVSLDSSAVKLAASHNPLNLLAWDHVIVFQIGSTAFCHDLKTQKTTTLCDDACLMSDFTVFPYVNSLACLV